MNKASRPNLSKSELEYIKQDNEGSGATVNQQTLGFYTTPRVWRSKAS
ncbi:hypothetical protein LAD64_25895 [Klebsiella pneumoniae]|nr:hypothetical protein [Klebsiella pneumoniae]